MGDGAAAALTDADLAAAAGGEVEAVGIPEAVEAAIPEVAADIPEDRAEGRILTKTKTGGNRPMTWPFSTRCWTNWR